MPGPRAPNLPILVIDRAKRAQLARLREDAELAHRKLLLVRPENRLVADNLERHRKETPAITPDMNERVATLVADLPRVWHDPRTPARDRKRMLRLLIDDVTLPRDDVIRVSIRWRGGATRKIECPLPLGAPDLRRTPAAVVELVRALATEQTDAQIAETLNGRWLRTGTGLPFSRLRVRMLREAYDIQSYVHPATASASHTKVCCAPCAPTTKTPSSSKRPPDRCPPPMPANGDTTRSSTPSLHRTYGKVRSMKPATLHFPRPGVAGRGAKWYGRPARAGGDDTARRRRG